MREPSIGLRVDALTVDQALADLTARLSGGSPPGPVDLLDLIQFTEQYLGNLEPVEHVSSFLQETIALYDRILAAPFDPCGLNPELLEKAASRLSHLLERTPSDRAESRPIGALDKLHILCVFQYALVQSHDDVLRVLRLKRSDVTPEPDSAGDTPDWLRSLLKIRFPQHAVWSDAVMAFISAWKETLEGACRFPAVMEHQRIDGSLRRHGYLRRLSLKIRNYAPETDEFSVAFATESDADTYLEPAILAGRTVLSSITPGAADRSYSGDYRVMNAGLAHAGHSAGLAIAGLFVCEAQRFSEQRRFCTIMAGTVFTGAVDESGAILDVAPDSLRAKLEAVFFSPARFMVLPQRHADAAEEFLSQLRERYPRRNLLLLGKSRLMDVFSDRRIISLNEIGRIRHAAVGFWRRKWAVSSVATALLFLMLGWAAWWYMLDPHPAALEVTAEGVRITNVSQRVLWSKEVNGATVSLHKRPSDFREHTALIDVNGDGFKDGFWIEDRNVEKGLPASLFSIDGQSLEPLWPPRSIELDIDYPFDVSITHGRMRPADIVVVDLEEDGTYELIVSLRHESYYPSALLTLDAVSGVERDIYHHAGVFSVVAAYDIDDDGKKEVLAGGTNNSFNDAVIVVLDSDRLSGIGPAQGDYRSSKPPTALEDHYIRFPRTSLARYAGLNSAAIWNIIPKAEFRTIRLGSRSVVRTTDTGEKQSGGIVWEMDFSMRSIGLGTDDPFDVIYELALENGFVDRPLDNNFKLDLLSRIQRYTADGWEPVPFSDKANLPPGYLAETQE